MYSRKSVGVRMDPWGTPELLDILVKISHPEPPKATYYWEKKKNGQILDLKFHKS